MPLRQRLPILPIPLREHEKRVNLDLQELINQAYVNGRYDRLEYKKNGIVPPLALEDAAWVDNMLKLAASR
jgi:hypothetical protein